MLILASSGVNSFVFCTYGTFIVSFLLEYNPAILNWIGLSFKALTLALVFPFEPAWAIPPKIPHTEISPVAIISLPGCASPIINTFPSNVTVCPERRVWLRYNVCKSAVFSIVSSKSSGVIPSVSKRTYFPSELLSFVTVSSYLFSNLFGSINSKFVWIISFLVVSSSGSPNTLFSVAFTSGFSRILSLFISPELLSILSDIISESEMEENVSFRLSICSDIEFWNSVLHCLGVAGAISEDCGEEWIWSAAVGALHYPKWWLPAENEVVCGRKLNN